MPYPSNALYPGLTTFPGGALGTVLSVATAAAFTMAYMVDMEF